MTLLLVMLAFAGIGAAVHRGWALVIPILVGCAVAGVMLAGGHQLADSPVPFLVLMATIATAAGILLRRQAHTPRA